MIDSLLIVLPGLIWGASFLFIAEGLEAVSPSGVAFVRILVGFLTLSLVPAVRRPIADAPIAARIAVLGVIWMAFPLTHVSVCGAARVVGARRDAERRGAAVRRGGRQRTRAPRAAAAGARRSCGRLSRRDPDRAARHDRSPADRAARRSACC